jgi:carboxylesterase type B
MTNEFFIAHTEYGSVRGKRTTSALGKEHISFLGIPYAKPPVGELRFKVSAVHHLIATICSF